MTVPKATLADWLNDHLPDSSTLHAALLDNNLQLNLAVTANPATNTLTSATPHKLVTGSRFRVATAAGGGNFVPAGTSSGVDYYAIATSATTLKLASSLANALANIEVDFTDAGQGLLINEQQLLADDPIYVLINHELPNTTAGYASRPTLTIGPASITATQARKDCTPISLAPTGGALGYRHIVLIQGGTNAPGNTTGQVEKLFTEAALATISDGEAKVIVVEPIARNV